ncbi:hypothetical protein EG68_00429 [Paragonimus skrjabini miyazakii]|uniref:Uncharacterized protein n=1 Tax=Paragonimus skrjabini miyazakii TaxID=59628 RepID=A0A8S9ZCD1_9TREM|nr:hypothetical protein EG68_00429 [Paragonimus skrjabini miyazakii]
MEQVNITSQLTHLSSLSFFWLHGSTLQDINSRGLEREKYSGRKPTEATMSCWLEFIRLHIGIFSAEQVVRDERCLQKISERIVQIRK